MLEAPPAKFSTAAEANDLVSTDFVVVAPEDIEDHQAFEAAIILSDRYEYATGIGPRITERVIKRFSASTSSAFGDR
jgi:hypothetical protein